MRRSITKYPVKYALNVNAIGIFQAVSTAFLLKASLKKNAASVYLLFFVLCLVLHISSSFLLYSFVDNYYFKKGFFSFLALAYGPLLWAYTRKLTNPYYSASVSFFSFLPFFIWGAAYLLILGRWIENPHGNFTWLKYYNCSLVLLLPFINIPYFLKSLYLANSFNGELEKEKHLIRFISYTGIILGVLTFVFTVIVIGADMPFNFFQMIIRSIVALGMIFICLNVLKYKVFPPPPVSIKEAIPDVVSDVVEMDTPETGCSETEIRTDTKNGLLSKERQQEIYEGLDKIMREQKLFVNPDLNMEKLVLATNISRHNISEALNHYANKPFYHFVNEYRVKMICEQMKRCSYQSSLFTLESLGKSCGFKSKTSFNEYFKKIRHFHRKPAFRKP
jgi:AraC-like DNA-binding protein